MSKKIKFNLKCGGVPIRTLEDLRNNFWVEDILGYYRNGLLLRWLEVHGFNEEWEAVNQVDLDQADLDDPEEEWRIVSDLVEIFGVENNRDEIEKSVYIMQYERKRRAGLLAYRTLDEKRDEIIADYFRNYEEIVQDIIANNEDYNKIKADVAEIAEKYTSAFRYNSKQLLTNLINNAPLAIYVVLMNDTMKDQYLQNNYCKKTIEDFNASTCSKVRKGADNPEYLSWMENIKIKSGKIEVWDSVVDRCDIVRDDGVRGRECMILQVESSNYCVTRISSAGRESMEPLTATEVKDFPKLNGLSYQSNSEGGYVIYMEV